MVHLLLSMCDGLKSTPASTNKNGSASHPANRLRAAEIAQWSRALAALSGVPSTNIRQFTAPAISAPGDQAFSSALHGHHAHVHTQAPRLTHK